MNITLQNYQAWFLDYHEGNLDDAKKRELFQFLDVHPHLREELDSYELLPLDVPDVSFPAKETLRKSDWQPDVFSKFISWHEGDLTPSEKQEVETFLAANPAYRKEFELCRKLKILPDYTIVFSQKSRLKKSRPMYVSFRTPARLAIAAALALLVLTYAYYRENEPDATLAVKAPAGSSQVSPVGKPAPADVASGQQHSPVRDVDTQSLPLTEKNKHQDGRQNKPQYKQQNRQPENQKFADVKPVAEPAGENQVALPVQKPPMPETATTDKMPVVQDRSTASLSREDLLEVFNEEELRELGLEEEKKKNSLWELVEKGAAGIGKATGQDIAVSRKSDDLQETRSYLFAVGSFSVSHKSER